MLFFTHSLYIGENRSHTSEGYIPPRYPSPSFALVEKCNWVELIGGYELGDFDSIIVQRPWGVIAVWEGLSDLSLDSK